MSTLVTIVHVIVAFALILVVLVQKTKGAEIGSTFGGSSQTLFGSRGPQSFLGKLTTGAAVLFMLTSLGLSLIGNTGGERSIMPAETATAPAQKSAPAPAPGQVPLTPPAPATDATTAPVESANPAPAASTETAPAGVKLNAGNLDITPEGTAPAGQ